MQKSVKITLLAASIGWLGAAAADEVADGTLAAAIREAGHPCAHVISKERAGTSVWRVRCNSGNFQVTMNEGDSPQVIPID